MELCRSTDLLRLGCLWKCRTLANLTLHPGIQLVVLNPAAGRGQSQAVYTSVVAPMLEQAGVAHELVVTRKAQEAKSLVHNLNTEAWDCVVAIGGDGLLSEIVQGLYSQDPVSCHPLTRLPLAIVPSGTGNGMAASFLYQQAEVPCPINAMFLILKAKSTVPADLSLVEASDGQRMSFLALSFGLVADVDLESEVIRWAGSFRMDLFALYAILRLRSYRARLSYLPSKEGPPPRAAALPPLRAQLPDASGWVHMEHDFLMVRGKSGREGKLHSKGKGSEGQRRTRAWRLPGRPDSFTVPFSTGFDLARESHRRKCTFQPREENGGRHSSDPGATSTALAFAAAPDFSLSCLGARLSCHGRRGRNLQCCGVQAGESHGTRSIHT